MLIPVIVAFCALLGITFLFLPRNITNHKTIAAEDKSVQGASSDDAKQEIPTLKQSDLDVFPLTVAKTGILDGKEPKPDIIPLRDPKLSSRESG